MGVILSGLVLISSIRYLNLHEDLTFKGKVIMCDDKKATVRINSKKVVVYHEGTLALGDYGEFKVKDVDYDFAIFDYSDYLLNKGITNYYELDDFDIEENRFVIAKIQDYLVRKTENNKYVNALIYAYKIDDEIYDSANKLGISHLLAVSGMHITILIGIVEFLLKKLFYFENLIDIFIVIFLIGYLFITNFELTIIRACLMVIFKRLFKHLNLKFTDLDIFSLTGIIVLLSNPRYLYLLSFQLSFMVSFVMIIFAKNIKISNKLIQAYVISLIAFLSTIPIVLNTNYEVNLLSIIIGPLYVLFFELILYPATIILYLFPKIIFIIDYVYDFFETSLYYLDDFKMFTFTFGKINMVLFILYYLIFYFLLVSFEIKRIRFMMTTSFILFISFLYNRAYFNPYYKIKVYDVGQGETILISLPFNQGNFLFDCYNNASLYLKSDGIRDINIIFLSHSHADHTSAYEDVIKAFNVGRTYTSYYSEISRGYCVKSGDSITYKNIKFDILGPVKNYDNENNNSLVIKVETYVFSMLFTGDIEKEAEDDLIRKYHNNLKSDILKVPHHGSKTSGSEEFLSYVNPNTYIVCVGKNNFYGLPNNQNLLTKKNVMRTDIDGTIYLKFLPF